MVAATFIHHKLLKSCELWEITRLVRLTKQGATGWGLRQLGFLAVGCVELLETSGRWRCSSVPGSSYTSHLTNWCQVWQLIQFLSVSLLLKRIIDLPGGQFNDHSLQRIWFSFVPPNNSRFRPCLRPLTRPVRCFPNYADTRTLSGVARQVWRSQDTVKNSWWCKPRSCVCWVYTHYGI